MSHATLPDLSAMPDLEVEQRYLTFWSNNQLFGTPIADIVQITGMQEITRIPDLPAYVKGIISLRGDVLPILDMRMRMGNPEEAYTGRSCIIIANIQDTLLGFITDEVDEVLDIPQEQISPPPRLSDSTATAYLSGIGRLQKEGDKKEKLVLILDLPKLLTQNEFAALAQAVQEE
jgi:purine-binding chemotaxis protein CheW